MTNHHRKIITIAKWSAFALCLALMSVFFLPDGGKARFVQLVELQKNPGPLKCLLPVKILDWGDKLVLGKKPPNAAGLLVYEVRDKKGTIDQYSIAWWEEPKYNPTTGDWSVNIFAQNLLSRSGAIDPWGITAYSKPIHTVGTGGIVAEVELGPPGARKQASGSAVIKTNSFFFKKSEAYELIFHSCTEPFVARYIFRNPNFRR